MTDAERHSLAALGARVHGWHEEYGRYWVNDQGCYCYATTEAIALETGWDWWSPATNIAQALDVLRAMPEYQQVAISERVNVGWTWGFDWFFYLTNEQKAAAIMRAVQAAKGEIQCSSS